MRSSAGVLPPGLHEMDTYLSRVLLTEVKQPEENRFPIQRVRVGVQVAFTLLCLWIGVEFHYFVGYLESGGVAPFVPRPPGVDGFLPISSLMSLYYLALSGSIHPYHPAGLFILSAIILMSLVFGKSFCSWLCPVGLLSEALNDLGSRLFGCTWTTPRWLDSPLRSLKYLLLGFFGYSIFFVMGEFALRQFLDSPYNLVADVKMYYFFVDVSRTSLFVISILLVLSIPIRGFWCRYLCPYGALLGIVGLLSPHKIRRDPVSCIGCGRCARACPSRIEVDRVRTVISDECTSCLSCLSSCPVKSTLAIKSLVTGKAVTARLAAVGIVGTFVLVTGAAMLLGKWHNEVSPETYLQVYPDVHTFGHPTSTSELLEMNREEQ